MIQAMTASGNSASVYGKLVASYADFTAGTGSAQLMCKLDGGNAVPADAAVTASSPTVRFAGDATGVQTLHYYWAVTVSSGTITVYIDRADM